MVLVVLSARKTGPPAQVGPAPDSRVQPRRGFSHAAAGNGIYPLDAREARLDALALANRKFVRRTLQPSHHAAPGGQRAASTGWPGPSTG